MDRNVAQIVEKFLESRRSGRKVSIDEVLETFEGLQDRAAVRRSAIDVIARQSRSGADGAPPDAREAPLPELEGYDVIERIGQGGMGVVYEAYQQSTGRRVALKFMLEGATSTEAARRRFEREVELAARLQHPNIVNILDSGAHRGRYYFVMEFISGAPLDSLFEGGAGKPAEPLRLMAKIAETVDYAHQRGVLHRDLKPSNILVDDRGEPRLLDFGLAKAIEPGMGGGPRRTLSEPGQLLGTLAYMSPEQSRGEYEQMSVRSDVYSLGAIAYELLTGSLPCDVEGSLATALRRIAEVDPARPSTLRKGLDADVDAILLKTLEKAPDRRYATAGELAADIRRFLADEPIQARRAGPMRRAARWVRRNRAVAIVGGLALGLIITVVTVSFVRIAKERDRAEDSARAQRAVSSFLLQGIEKLSPDKSPGDKITFEELLNQWDVDLAQLSDRPEVQADVRSSIGQAFRNLSDYERARQQYALALEARRRLFPEHSAEIASSLHNLAAALWWLGDYDRAEEHYREALYIRRALYVDGDPATGADLARTLQHLSSTLSREDRFSDAEPLARESLGLRGRLLGDQHVDLVQSLNDLATILNDHGRHADAEPLCRRALEILERQHGDQTRGMAFAFHNLARCRLGQGDASGALALLDRSTELLRRLFQDRTNDFVARGLALRAEIQRAAGDLHAAEGHAERALDIRRRIFPPVHPDVAESLHIIGTLRLARADLAGAREALRECVDIRRQIWRRPHWLTAAAQADLGRCLLRAGRTDEAEPLLIAGHAGLLAKWGADDPRVVEAASNLANVRASRDAGPDVPR